MDSLYSFAIIECPVPDRLLGIQRWVRRSLTSRNSESGETDGGENKYSQSPVLSNDTDEHRWDMTIEHPERQHLTLPAVRPMGVKDSSPGGRFWS